jgi:hypothetical protein
MSGVPETLSAYLGHEPSTDELRACNFGWQEGFEAGTRYKQLWEEVPATEDNLRKVFTDEPS